MRRNPFGIRLVAFVCLCFALVAAQAATITVNSTADVAANDGQCTLREAIIAANTNTASGAAAGECVAGQASPTIDVIVFALSGAGCAGSPVVCTISPVTQLPQLFQD